MFHLSNKRIEILQNAVLKMPPTYIGALKINQLETSFVVITFLKL